MKFRKLKANEIDVRVQSIVSSGAILLLYKDARADMNILNETIYKATALQKNLGLHSKFSIFTLSTKNDEVKELHLDRGRLFNINIICRQEILECDNLTQFFLSIS